MPENPNLVPKVHPATRPVEPEDPMSLHATPVAGDPDLMFRCVVEEYARSGWHADQIAALFQSPQYPVLEGLGRRYSPAGLREAIAAVVGRSGVFGCVGGEADVGPEPEVVSLGTDRLVGSPGRE